MKPEYFIIRMHYDRAGRVISGSEEIIQYIDDEDIIIDAEASHAMRKVVGKGGRADMIKEGAKARKRKSDRPTVPEMPSAIAARWE